MASQRIDVEMNDVNGSNHTMNATSSGRRSYGLQVVSDRHQETGHSAIGSNVRNARLSEVYENENENVQGMTEEQRVIHTRNKRSLRIGAWNINTLYQTGKYENIKQEMKRLNLDILGLSEVRWKGAGELIDKDIRFIYSGGETHHKGVGIMMSPKVAKSVIGYWAVSERILLVKLAGKQINLNIIQV